MNRPTFQGVRRLPRARIRWQYWQSNLGAFRDRAHFAALRRFVLFVGYARSGHTVLASILDAHPDAAIANELDVVGYVDNGFRRRQLLHMILTNARETHERGNEWTGYSYRVPNGWQGRLRTPLVMGDKKAGVTTRRVAADPSLLDHLRREMRVPLRILHVVRNPYDHVVARRRHHGDAPMPEMLDALFGLYDGIETLRRHVSGDESLRIRAEDLIRAPEKTLRRVLRFLELSEPDPWVENATSILFSRPSKRRDDHDWTDAERAAVEERIARHDFLHGYTFDE